MARMIEYAFLGLAGLVVVGNLGHQIDGSGPEEARRAAIVSKNYDQPLLEFDINGHKVSSTVSPMFYANHVVGDILSIEVRHGLLSDRLIVHVDERAAS